VKPLVPIVNGPPPGGKYQCQLDWPEDADIRCSYNRKLGLDYILSENPEEPSCSFAVVLPVPLHLPALDYWHDHAIHRSQFGVTGGASGEKAGGWIAAEEMAHNRLQQILNCPHDWRNTCWNLSGDGTCVNCRMFVHGMFMDQGLQNTILLAHCAHEGQKRKYVDAAYITHPSQVFDRINWWRRDLPMGQWLRMAKAAWLHDVIEDCPNTPYTAIISTAGEDVYRLVLELTNPSKGWKLPRAERKKMDRDHLKTVSWEAKVIKFFDRSCNLRDMEQCQDKRFLALYCDESEAMWEEVFLPYRKVEGGPEDAFIDIHMEAFYLSWLNAARKRSV